MAMYWYKMAQQLEFDFSEQYLLEDLISAGFKSLGNGRFSLKIGNTLIQGDPDALVSNLNFIIGRIQDDGNFLSNLVQQVADIDEDLRERGDMRLTEDEKIEYKNRVLEMIRGLKNSNISDKNKIAVRNEIEDIAETFMKNPTWIRMKLQTVNKKLSNFSKKIWAQVRAISKKRDLLIDGIRIGFLRSYQSYNLNQKTQGYTIEKQNNNVYKIIKPNGQEYLVDMNSRSCNCPAGERGVPCKHLALVDQYVNPPSRR